MQITVTLDTTKPEIAEAELNRLMALVKSYTTPAPVSPAATERHAAVLARLGPNTRATYSALLEICDEQGEATLEDAGLRCGKSVETLRAHMMNAGRSLAENENPFVAKWDEIRKCVVYTLA
jgi:hypothetical protein